MTLHIAVLFFEGVYYFLTGLWPIIHVESFELVTGKKKEKLTLFSTASLVTVIGFVLASGAREKRPDPALTILGAGSALSLATVEVANARNIRPVYLLDAIGETALAVLLIWSRVRLK